jgi:hypothetical protein
MFIAFLALDWRKCDLCADAASELIYAGLAFNYFSFTGEFIQMLTYV